MKFTPAKTLLVAAMAALPVLASAQLTANVALTTNYKFRGQDQTENRPALQGGFDYAHESGFYVGNWNSSISWIGYGSGLESDIYGGYKFSYGDFGFDVGALRYIYARAGAFNTTELYGAATFGPLTGKYSRTVSGEYFGAPGTRGTGYWNLAYEQGFDFAPGVTFKAALGYTDFNGPGQNYTDYSVGAGYELGNGFMLSGAVVGANKRSFYGDVNKTRLIVALSKSL